MNNSLPLLDCIELYAVSRNFKVRVTKLKPTTHDNSKGNRISPSLFYTSELQSKYIKLIGVLVSY